LDRNASALYVLHQLTARYYNCDQPNLSSYGKYLVIRTNQRFSPSYSSFDNSWVYVNSAQLALIPLHDTVRSPFLAVNDTVQVKEKAEDEDKDKDEEKNEAEDEEKEEVEDEEKDVDEVEAVTIQFDDLEQKMIILPLKPGNVSRPSLVGGKVFYLRQPVADQDGGSTQLQYFDLEEQEESVVISGIQFFQFTSDEKQIITGTRQRMGFIKPAKDQKLEK